MSDSRISSAAAAGKAPPWLVATGQAALYADAVADYELLYGRELSVLGDGELDALGVVIAPHRVLLRDGPGRQRAVEALPARPAPEAGGGSSSGNESGGDAAPSWRDTAGASRGAPGVSACGSGDGGYDGTVGSGGGRGEGTGSSLAFWWRGGDRKPPTPPPAPAAPRRMSVTNWTPGMLFSVVRVHRNLRLAEYCTAHAAAGGAAVAHLSLDDAGVAAAAASLARDAFGGGRVWRGAGVLPDAFEVAVNSREDDVAMGHALARAIVARIVAGEAPAELLQRACCTMQLRYVRVRAGAHGALRTRVMMRCVCVCGCVGGWVGG